MPGAASASITLTEPLRQRATLSAVYHLPSHRLFGQTRYRHSFSNLTMRGNKLSGPVSSHAAAPGSAGVWGAKSGRAWGTLCVPARTRHRPSAFLPSREAGRSSPQATPASTSRSKARSRGQKTHLLGGTGRFSRTYEGTAPIPRRSPRNRGHALHR